MKPTAPYEEGRWAYSDGKPLCDNPYPDPESEESIEWEAGWMSEEENKE
jgi:hypothetical protein